MKAKLLAIMAMLLVSYSVQAQCPVQKTTMFFGNGMDNTTEEAIDSKNLLKRILEQQPFFNPECVEVKLAYSRTEGLTTDLLEAARQKEIEEDLTPTNFWEMFERLTAPRPWFLNLMAGAFFAVDRPNPSDAKILAQIQEHLALYRAEPADNLRIHFGHSQGTLFGNEVWLAMTPEERDRTKLLAVATPAEDVVDGGPYTTIEEDAIITNTFVGELAPNIFAPNRDDGTLCPDDWACHGIGTSYLFPNTASRVKILADVKALLPTFQTGDPTTLSGFVRREGSFHPVSGVSIVVCRISAETDQSCGDILAETTSESDGLYQTASFSDCTPCAVEAIVMIETTLYRAFQTITSLPANSGNVREDITLHEVVSVN